MQCEDPDVSAPFSDTQCAAPQDMAIHSSPCSLQSPDDDALIAMRKTDNLKQNHRQRQTLRHMWVAVTWTETDFSGFKVDDRLQRLGLSLNQHCSYRSLYLAVLVKELALA